MEHVMDVSTYVQLSELFADISATPATTVNNTSSVPPPFTPGTNRKLEDALSATFATFHSHRLAKHIPTGMSTGS